MLHIEYRRFRFRAQGMLAKFALLRRASQKASSKRQRTLKPVGICGKTRLKSTKPSAVAELMWNGMACKAFSDQFALGWCGHMSGLGARSLTSGLNDIREANGQIHRTRFEGALPYSPVPLIHRLFGTLPLAARATGHYLLPASRPIATRGARAWMDAPRLLA